MTGVTTIYTITKIARWPTRFNWPCETRRINWWTRRWSGFVARRCWGRRMSDYHSASWMPWSAGASRRTTLAGPVGPSRLGKQPTFGRHLDGNRGARQNSHRDRHRDRIHHLHLESTLPVIEVQVQVQLTGGLRARLLRIARGPRRCSHYAHSSPTLRFDRAIRPFPSVFLPTAARSRCSR